MALFNVSVSGSTKPKFKPAKLAHIPAETDGGTGGDDAEFDYVMSGPRLDIFRQLRQLSYEIISTHKYHDPEAFVKGLLKYCLYLTSLFNRIHHDKEGGFLAREGAANILPDFLMEAMDEFRSRLSEAVRSNGKANTKTLIDSDSGQRMIHYNPEDVLCLRSLLVSHPRFECYRRSLGNICHKFFPYQVIIQRFLVSYSLVKRLSDVIHAAFYVFTHDGRDQEAFAAAVDGSDTEFSDKRLVHLRELIH